jgi:lipoic acid synthetase
MKTIDIPVVAQSGQKYTTAQGCTAVKNGMKSRSQPEALVTRGNKPKWLKVKQHNSERFRNIKAKVRKHQLQTVCEEAMCPNMSECWTAGTATLMLMGQVCTRACGFCAVDTGNPQGWLDAEEPQKVADTVAYMGLGYVVITSVNRDDLADGGAGHFAACVRAIKCTSPGTAVEVLTPDFQGDTAAVDTLVASGITVFAHNIETIARLTRTVRDPRATYDQSLAILAYCKQVHPKVLVKTSLMLGLGESVDEVKQAMRDCRAIGVDIVTLGQYLQPTQHHLPVQRFVPPKEFASLREWGLAQGFLEVAAGPMVRSSYRAEQVLAKNNVGLDLSQMD